VFVCLCVDGMVAKLL